MNNLEKMQGILTGGKADALLLTSQVSRHYAACYDVAEGVAVVGREKSFYFTDSRYIEVAQNELKGFTVLETNREHTYPARINAALEELGAKTLGIEEAYLTHSEYLHYEETLHAQLVPCQKEISVFRQIKEDWEIDYMVKAQEITDQTFDEMCTLLKPGMTEKEVAAELIYRLLKNGADGLSFDPIVVSGPNTSMPHGVAGERKLQEGDFVTMDFGVIYQGYCSDMTRTVAMGYATEEMQKVYNTVLEAQLAGLAISKAGTIGQDIDGAARKVIADAGYGPYFSHGYGHGVGLEVHESPSPNTRNDQPIPAGAVCSAEPGIYLPGKFGVRIEDCCIYLENGHENLAHSPKNLIIL